jgi:hypothetical protein
MKFGCIGEIQMYRDLMTKIEALRWAIVTNDFYPEARTLRSYGGADVIITSRLDAEIKKWMGD